MTTRSVILALLLLAAATNARRRPAHAQQRSSNQLPKDPWSRAPSAASSGETLRHLFSTPLLSVDMSSRVNVTALAAIARDGYNEIAESDQLQHAVARLVGDIRPDDPLPPANNLFFRWQQRQRDCKAQPTARCANMRWAAYHDDPAVSKLRDELYNLSLSYLHSCGVPDADVPQFEIRVRDTNGVGVINSTAMVWIACSVLDLSSMLRRL